jgi:tetratricopeptide (TPR) repeat protein
MKILIAVATYNRPIVTELCLQNLQLVRDSETKIVIYDDNSDAYSLEFLRGLADEVVRFNARQGIEKSRAQTFRDFLTKYPDYELLYLTDNDAIHDPSFAARLREIFEGQKQSSLPIHPAGLFNSTFHQGRILGQEDQFSIYETCPGISMCLTRSMVQKIVGYLDEDVLNESSYGWDMRWPKAIGLPFKISKTSYVEHFARDRFESGMHSTNSGVALENALKDFDRDRALNPSEYLIEARPQIIREILGGWSVSDQAISTMVANALKKIQENQFLEAQELLLQALTLDSGNPNIIRFLSVVSALQFDYQKALQLIDEAIQLAPGYAIAHSNKGNILKELGRHKEALIALDLAIKLDPSYAEAYMNKGNVLYEMTRYQDALTWFDKAIGLQSNYAEAYSNKGNTLVLMDRPQEAMQCFDQATAINPNYVDAYWHKGLLQLIYGDYENGWQNYEARWFKSNPIQFQFTNTPRLESLNSIAGKKILIWSEQGLGDTLQFCRYIKPLFELGAQVTFGVPAPLLNVLGGLTKFCNLITIDDIKNHGFDFQSPLLSLPLLFKTDLESIPNQMPYLEVNQAQRNAYEQDLVSKQNLRVGLIWNGGFRAEHPELWAINKRRNIELDQIAKLQGIPGVDFFSLQKGDPAESELAARKDQVWPELINCVHLLNDFSDTAALMDCLDLIISVDTSSAHLAGALGKPVWILNRYDSCWRWLRGREDSPWYPTAKIYQQKQPGNWDEVIARVRLDLNDLAQKKRAAL